MPRQSISETAMTSPNVRHDIAPARGWRAGCPQRRHIDRRSRSNHGTTPSPWPWTQAGYAGWLDALPDNQQDSAFAEVLRAIVELICPSSRRLNRRGASGVIQQSDGRSWATIRWPGRGLASKPGATVVVGRESRMR